jgi:energy-coupling factor transport system ATP-binding protein
VIETRSVTFRYAPDTPCAVEDVSIRIEPGEVVGIVGPNGSGKSTLGRLLKGLILPDEGAVVVDGCDSMQDGLEVRRLVGLVFQNPNSQIVNSVVEQEVAFGPENLGLPAEEIRSRVDDVIAAVALHVPPTTETHKLTMADKQRVAIASVIAMEPRYLVLDEPTAWIEPRARWRLLSAITEWAAGTNPPIGLVLVTHRMDEALLCSRLYGMRGGHILAEGRPDDLLQNAETRDRLALAVPDAYVLTAELSAAGLPITPGEPLNKVAEALCRS